MEVMSSHERNCSTTINSNDFPNREALLASGVCSFLTDDLTLVWVSKTPRAEQTRMCAHAVTNHRLRIKRGLNTIPLWFTTEDPQPRHQVVEQRKPLYASAPKALDQWICSAAKRYIIGSKLGKVPTSRCLGNPPLAKRLGSRPFGCNPTNSFQVLVQLSLNPRAQSTWHRPNPNPPTARTTPPSTSSI
jgi:hypothetical protein